MTDQQLREYAAYVETLHRLVLTIRDGKRRDDSGMEEEAQQAINRMRAHVLATHGASAWAAVEEGADDLLAMGNQRPPNGVVH
jgi:hypothetical protein